MRIALQHLPVLVAGDHGDGLDVPVSLEEPTDRFVAQVVEVQILNRRFMADAPERSANRAAAVGEDEPPCVAGALALLLVDGRRIEVVICADRPPAWALVWTPLLRTFPTLLQAFGWIDRATRN